jgi:hypothetical protein
VHLLVLIVYSAVHSARNEQCECDGCVYCVVQTVVYLSPQRGSVYDMIYLLTAAGLSPGGSTHLHTNNTQNNTK